MKVRLAAVEHEWVVDRRKKSTTNGIVGKIIPHRLRRSRPHFAMISIVYSRASDVSNQNIKRPLTFHEVSPTTEE